MKTLLAGFFALVFSLSAQAKDEVCRVYEFAELNTFSPVELERMALEYGDIVRRIDSIPPLTAAELREDMADKRNCSGERDRINRILATRRNVKTK